MKRIFSAFIALILLCMPAHAMQTMPSQDGIDAASALVAMHAAVMDGVIGSDYRFSEIAGGDSIFVLYTDDEAKNYLMVSLTGEDNSLADMAVMQSYSLFEFDTNIMDSMAALATPFIGDEDWADFEKWMADNSALIGKAAREGNDVELTYYTGKYVVCAVSLYHDGTSPMFTALVSWNSPLSDEDITALMEGDYGNE